MRRPGRQHNEFRTWLCLPCCLLAERLVSCRPYYLDELTKATYYQMPQRADSLLPCGAKPAAKKGAMPAPVPARGLSFGRLLLELRQLHRQGRLSADEAERLQHACMAEEPALQVVAMAISELPRDASFSGNSSEDFKDVFVDLAKKYLSSLI